MNFSKITPTSWTKNTKALLFSLLDALEARTTYFICPLFGVELPLNTIKKSAKETLLIQEYRGFSYYVKKFHSSTLKTWCYSFGIVGTPMNNNFEYSVICLIDEARTTLYNFGLDSKPTQSEILKC